jgi:hypothetical protein
MDDIRFQKVEAQVHKHEQLHTSYKEKFGNQAKVNDATIENLNAVTGVVIAIQASIKAHENNTAAAVKLTEKMETLAEALGILGVFAKWVLAVSAMCGIIIAGIKGLR